MSIHVLFGASKGLPDSLGPVLVIVVFFIIN